MKVQHWRAVALRALWVRHVWLGICAALALHGLARAETIEASYDLWQANGFSRSVVDEIRYGGVGESLANDALLGTGSLSGFVYLDANGNGVRENSDWSIADANVELTAKDSSIDLHATTDSGGSYSFQNLPAGTYMITLLTPSAEPGPVSVPLGGSGQAFGQVGIVEIRLDDGHHGDNYDFPQLVYPTNLISKRMLLNSNPGIVRITTAVISEPGTLALVAVAGVLFGGLKWRRRRNRG
jgi:hypothetical protein